MPVLPLVQRSVFATHDLPGAPEAAGAGIERPTGAEDIRWNLDDLYPSVEELREDLGNTLHGGERLAREFAGRIASLDAPHLASFLHRLAALHDSAGRAYAYAFLAWATDTADAARGALLQEVQEAYARHQQNTVFFDVEWAALDAGVARSLASDPVLASYRHALDLMTERQRHVLSEEVERVLADVDVTGRAAWTRYFDQLLSAARFDLDGASLSEQEVLSRLHNPDRELRRRAAASLTAGLEPLAPSLAFVFNTVLADKASRDRLRGYDGWITARNQANEVDDASVDALVTSVASRYDLAQRFYRLKARLLGLDVLEDTDRYAPLPDADAFYTWDEARRVVTSAYADFHADAGAIVARFFDERWIDAPAVPGKRGGAFSHSTVPSAHPYVLMNYTGRVRDVQTLAHELGHGLHQTLAREQGVFHADTPLTTAETASVFGEMLTHRRLLSEMPDDRARLALAVSRLDDTMATVFRQVSMNRFEDAIHTARRGEGELSLDRFDDLWEGTQRDLYGDSVALGPHYRRWWCYIPHMVHTPGYVYAYAFGELLVLALAARYDASENEDGGRDAFATRYLDLLRAGGSDYPHVLAARLGVDLTDPEFWNGGLDKIAAMIADAEALADRLDAASAHAPTGAGDGAV